MTSRLTMANQALALCGANTIESFDESSNEAGAISRYYDDLVEDTFSADIWPFASKRLQLERINDGSGNAVPALTQWKYQFIIPTECLYIHKIFNTPSFNARPTGNFDKLEDVILADDPVIYAEYGFYAPENTWPGHFKAFFIHALAARIAVELTDDFDLRDRYRQEAYGNPSSNYKGGLYGRSLAAAKRQRPGQMIAHNPLATARFTTIYSSGIQ